MHCDNCHWKPCLLYKETEAGGETQDCYRKDVDNDDNDDKDRRDNTLLKGTIIAGALLTGKLFQGIWSFLLSLMESV